MKNFLLWLALTAASWCQQSGVVVVLAQQRQPCSGVVFESAKARTISAAMLETATTSDGTGGNDDRHDAVVEVRYKGSAPTRRFFLSTKYHYEQKVALSDCVTPLSDDDNNNAAITPAVTGEIPDADFDAEAGVLATKIYLDTEAIRNTPDLWTPSAASSDGDITKGTIEFCVLTNLYSDRKGDVAVASEAVQVALDIDAAPPNDAEANGMVTFTDESYTRATTGDGTHDGHHQNHDHDDNGGQQVTTASVNEPEERQYENRQDFSDDSSPVVVEYCDDSNRAVTPAPTLFPGDVLQVCVRTAEAEKDSDATDTTTLNVCSVAFANSLSNLYVEVIDGKGKETNSAVNTLKTCSGGACNIKVVTVESLYPYEDDVKNAGATTSLVGKALLKKNSAGPRGRNLEEATTTTTVAKFAMDLQDSLVPLPGGRSTKKASSFSFQSKRGAMTCALAASVAVALVLVAVLVFATLLRRKRQNSNNNNNTLPTTAKTTEGGAHVDGSDASATTLEADRSSDDGSSTMANTVDDSL